MSRWMLLRMRSVADKSSREIKTRVLFSITFFLFRKSRSWRDNVEKYRRAGQAKYDNMAYAHCMQQVQNSVTVSNDTVLKDLLPKIIAGLQIVCLQCYLPEQNNAGPPCCYYWSCGSENHSAEEASTCTMLKLFLKVLRWFQGWEAQTARLVTLHVWL